MKVLLIALQSNTDTIGLKYILSCLRSNGIHAYILFLPTLHPGDMMAIRKFVREFSPGIIGISLMSESFDKARMVSSEIRKECAHIVITWGGIHPSIAPRACLEYADYVFIGESENSFLEFIRTLEERRTPHSIQNLAFLQGDKIVINPLRPLINNLDSLPFPEHHPENSFVLHRNKIVKMDRRLFEKYSRFSGRFYSIMSIRGCPFSCSYCCNSFLAKLYGEQRIRTRSVDNIIEELRCAISMYPDIIYVIIHDDDFFAHDIDWIKHFADSYNDTICRRFICCGTPRTITAEKIRTLKSCGLSWVFIGLQSGSSRTKREIYKRSVTNEALLTVAQLAHECGIAPLYDVILDNPFEKEEDLRETVRLILALPKPFQFQLYSLTFYEGTEIYRMAIERGLHIENPCEKNYFHYRRTFFNKIIRLCPLLPRPVIAFLVHHRNAMLTKVLLNAVYPLAIVFLEPLVWCRLILISFDYSVGHAATMTRAFIKTGVKKIILRQSA